MRPVERGPKLLKPDGSTKSYSSYANARRDLIDRMGQYCSYCNHKLPASLAVEHVQPKSLVPGLELEWENFLLGCTNCNSIKSNKPVTMSEYLWPDVHNTHMAFVYTPDGKINVDPSLEKRVSQKAQKLLDLVGLQKYPNESTASDRRWQNRKETFIIANAALLLYTQASAKGAAKESEELLSFLAAENGFFSIWMQIFDSHPNVKRKITAAFKGTSANCFDRDHNAIKRTVEL